MNGWQQISLRDTVEHLLHPIIPTVVNIIVILQVNKHAAHLLKLHLHHLAHLPYKVMRCCFFCISFQADLNNSIPHHASLAPCRLIIA